jgi:hypothetical protein
MLALRGFKRASALRSLCLSAPYFASLGNFHCRNSRSERQARIGVYIVSQGGAEVA